MNPTSLSSLYTDPFVITFDKFVKNDTISTCLATQSWRVLMVLSCWLAAVPRDLASDGVYSRSSSSASSSAYSGHDTVRTSSTANATYSSCVMDVITLLGMRVCCRCTSPVGRANIHRLRWYLL